MLKRLKLKRRKHKPLKRKRLIHDMLDRSFQRIQLPRSGRLNRLLPSTLTLRRRTC